MYLWKRLYFGSRIGWIGYKKRMKRRHSRVLPQFLAWTLEWRMVLFAKMEKTDFGSRCQEFSYVLTELEKPDTQVGNW